MRFHVEDDENVVDDIEREVVNIHPSRAQEKKEHAQYL